MAKFVKLENGTYLNVDQIITIKNHAAYTLGLDREWMAHSVKLTDSDLQKILETTGSGETEQLPTLDKHVVELAIEALAEKDGKLGSALGAVENSNVSAGYAASARAEIEAEHEEVWNARGDLEEYLEELKED